MPDLTRFPLAYCETCKIDRPYRVDVVEATKDQPAYADLVCTVCATIVVTVTEAGEN